MFHLCYDVCNLLLVFLSDDAWKMREGDMNRGLGSSMYKFRLQYLKGKLSAVETAFLTSHEHVLTQLLIMI